ncbi:hypothetical protein AX768_09030 [Burkholderia sp. PAMC 28687]|uniref:hypothetical protein n=1 Tax=Burkholderia sp. PAMC 28687 TaxID=1795874 RepID=UPI0007838761|nr:hypothetical protein [Burkholderia sp. PAMC 28687]AMM14214.1 hypothetical protein AX768_09030 [Burkholderia sp. PAMC 28687]
MKTSLIAVAILALGIAGHAQAQSTAVAQQQASSDAKSFGALTIASNPEHTSETVRNVSAPILGAYASSFSQMNCSSTTQGGIAFAGFSAGGGSSKDSATCVLEVAAAELTRQATVDPLNHDALVSAAIGVRCQVSAEVYNAMRDAGFDCKRKPASLMSRTDDQPASTRVAGN